MKQLLVGYQPTSVSYTMSPPTPPKSGSVLSPLTESAKSLRKRLGFHKLNSDSEIANLGTNLAELSTEAQEARKPLPPEELVDALQDKVSANVGKCRSAKASKAWRPLPGDTKARGFFARFYLEHLHLSRE